MADLLRQNLLSPVFLAFVLGWVAALLKSDLRLPPGAYTVLSAYLLFSIGLKGGVSLSGSEFGAIGGPVVACILLGAAIPIIVYNIARRLGRIDRVNSASLAAHYGSVSAVTFIACLTFLDAGKVPYEPYVTALVAILEVPGIMVALLIFRIREPQEPNMTPGDEIDPGPSNESGLLAAIHEVITGKSIMLLLGGMAIGILTGSQGLEKVKPFFVDPFQGVLTIFMLEMGLLAASRAGDVRKVGGFIVAWGLIGPLLLGSLGVLVGKLVGMSPGGMTVLGVLAGSASYIAAPAAVRVGLPAANPSLSLTPAVALTFPFNLSVGIPLLHAFASRL